MNKCIWLLSSHQGWIELFFGTAKFAWKIHSLHTFLKCLMIIGPRCPCLWNLHCIFYIEDASCELLNIIRDGSEYSLFICKFLVYIFLLNSIKTMFSMNINYPLDMGYNWSSEILINFLTVTQIPYSLGF